MAQVEGGKVEREKGERRGTIWKMLERLVRRQRVTILAVQRCVYFARKLRIAPSIHEIATDVNAPSGSPHIYKNTHLYINIHFKLDTFILSHIFLLAVVIKLRNTRLFSLLFSPKL